LLNAVIEQTWGCIVAEYLLLLLILVTRLVPFEWHVIQTRVGLVVWSRHHYLLLKQDQGHLDAATLLCVMDTVR
jgi:hypothetical protein